MATASESTSRRPEVPELCSGDALSREEFHRIYALMPEDFKAELIGGIVYVASPLKHKHGTNHLPLGSLFFAYELQTPGVESGDNATILLGVDSEPQPDLYLRIMPECGGRSRTTSDDYLEGPPELIAEIAVSSRSIDLHTKMEDYARNGILEYLVLCPNEAKLRWFDLRAGQEQFPDADGVYKIRQFPGLWILGEALLNKDQRLFEVLNQGLASPEHAEFVKQLAAKSHS